MSISVHSQPIINKFVNKYTDANQNRGAREKHESIYYDALKY
jgi:hypothetical protein